MLNYDETSSSFSFVSSYVPKDCDDEAEILLATIEEEIENDPCIEEEELYDCTICFQSRGKVNKKQHGLCHTPAHGKKSKNKKLRDHRLSRAKVLSRLEKNADKKIVKTLRKRTAKRRENQFAHLEARKENSRARVAPWIRPINYSHDNNDNDGGWERWGETEYTRNEFQILPAQELGIEEGCMYDRLLSILNGDASITPDDYDLLLQLDTHNVKPVMEEAVIEEIPTLTIGNSEGEQMILRSNLGGTKCDICLEDWADLSNGTQVRRLPCGHVFCKSCIDYWLKEVSDKCPNLGCYWCKGDD